MNQVQTRKIHVDLSSAAAWGAVAMATLLLFAAIVAIPVLRAPSTIAPAVEIDESRSTCGDQYNALVKQAKDDLVKGDRAGAVRLLRAAQVQLHTCEVRTAQDVEPMFRN